MVTDRLLGEIARQDKYLEKLPQDFQFPLFNAKTAVESQRQNGYRNTASAARELVDNALEAGATRIDIILERTRGGRADSISAVACLDNGAGMTKRMARYALSWGGGTHFEDPNFIGKFGFGLPNASINQTRRVEVYTLAKGTSEIYRAWLDLDEATSEFGLQTIPEPTQAELPDFVKKYLKDNKLTFKHGTAVVWLRPDRLTYRTGASLKEHLLDDFGVTYRYLLDDFELYVDGARVEIVDPLFLDPRGRYYVPPEQGGAIMPEAERVLPVRYFRDPETGGRHLAKVADAIQVDQNDKNLLAVGNIAIKVARFPRNFAIHKKGKSEADAHKRFDVRSSRRGMTFVRAGREIETVDAFPRSKRDEASGLGQWPLLQGYAYHWGVEVKFDPALDDVFGITNDKQRVRPIEDFWRLLHKEDIDGLLRRENLWQTKQREHEKPKAEPSDQPTPGETAAAAVNTITGKVPRLPDHERPTATRHLEEEAKRRANVTKESIDQAIKALEEEKKRRPYMVTYADDPRGAFYEPEWSGTQVVIKINKAHPLFTTLYADLLRLPGGRRAKESIDVLLIALGRAELQTEDETAKLWYARQRTDVWSPFLSDALNVLAQTLQPVEEPEEGAEVAVA
jgi:hypothetical protein